MREPKIEDLLVIEEGCGLRPGRKGGVRLQVELYESSALGRKVPVVYNYGWVHNGNHIMASVRLIVLPLVGMGRGDFKDRGALLLDLWSFCLRVWVEMYVKGKSGSTSKVAEISTRESHRTAPIP